MSNYVELFSLAQHITDEDDRYWLVAWLASECVEGAPVNMNKIRYVLRSLLALNNGSLLGRELDIMTEALVIDHRSRWGDSDVTVLPDGQRITFLDHCRDKYGEEHLPHVAVSDLVTMARREAMCDASPDLRHTLAYCKGLDADEQPTATGLVSNGDAK